MTSLGCSCVPHPAQLVNAPGHRTPLREADAGEAIIDLSSNENPLGPSPNALTAIAQAARQAHRYPDREGTVLKAALAERLGVERGQLLLGNGSAELIDAVARATLRAGDEAIIGVPTFPSYRSSIERAGATAMAVPLLRGAEDLNAMARRVSERTRLLIVANPNNPAGGTFGAAEWRRFLAGLPRDVVVIADEAYYEYVDRPDYPRTLEAVAAGHRVVVLRSFSKAYGLAGVRIGYGVAPASLRQRIEAQLQRFNTSRIAQEAALAALQDAEHLARSVEMNAQGRLYLQRELTAMGYSVAPSETNFLLVPMANAAQMHERLGRAGVRVKRLDAFGMTDALRVSVGRPEENDRFLEALAQASSEAREANTAGRHLAAAARR